MDGPNNGATSSRKIDYRQVDFGYKNKEVPNIPGIDYGKIDMATFLNDNQDLIYLENEASDKLPKSARIDAKTKNFNLDLEKVKQIDSAEPRSSNRGHIGMFENSSLSQRSFNQQILAK